MKHLSVLIASAALLLAACGDSGKPSTPLPEDTATPPAATASPTPGMMADLPMPQRVSFAPGEVVSADGPGMFFTDPYTGATEGWYLPDAVNKQMPFEFSVGDVTADGKLLLYECQRHDAEGRLAPCGSNDPLAPHVWHLFNTETGERRRLSLTGSTLTLAPDGRTLFTLERDKAAFVSVESGERIEIPLPFPNVYPPMGVSWSPRGNAIVLGLQRDEGEPEERPVDMMLFRTDRPEPVKLLEGSAFADWSPDGSRVAFVLSNFEYDGETPGILVFDAMGRRLWSSPLGGYPNPRWSPDSSRLAVQIDFEVKAGSAVSCSGGAPACILSHLDVFDGATGEPLYRVAGAIACADEVWTADGSRLVVSGYASGGSVVVDPAAGTFRPLQTYVVPTPFDAGLAIIGGEDGFYAVDLTTGEVRLLVETTVRAAWDWLHEPLFVGGRIKFTALHGGHGGCAMGSAPEPPPELEILYPPFGE